TCWPSWRATQAGCFSAASYWTWSGGTTFLATRGPSTCTSSSFVRSWRWVGSPTRPFRRCGGWVTSWRWPRAEFSGPPTAGGGRDSRREPHAEWRGDLVPGAAVGGHPGAGTAQQKRAASETAAHVAVAPVSNSDAAAGQQVHRPDRTRTDRHDRQRQERLP